MTPRDGKCIIPSSTLLKAVDQYSQVESKPSFDKKFVIGIVFEYEYLMKVVRMSYLSSSVEI